MFSNSGLEPNCMVILAALIKGGYSKIKVVRIAVRLAGTQYSRQPLVMGQFPPTF